MIRRRKDVDWLGELRAEDFALVQQRIIPEAWYPMASFERLGLAILGNLQGAELETVRLWGNYSAHQLVREYTTLLAAGDPVETLMRLRVQRATLFDFPAFDIPSLIDGQALMTMSYGMGAIAEEAACHQTLGFCEAMVALAGGQNVRGALGKLSWLGAPHTTLVLDWEPPRRTRPR